MRSLSCLWSTGLLAALAACGEGPTENVPTGAPTMLGGAGSADSASSGPGGGSSETGGSGGGNASGGAGRGGTNTTDAGESGGTNATGGGGSDGTGGSGGGTGNTVFGQCRVHFGTIDSKAKASPSMIPELDFFTPAWMGSSDNFDQKFVCDEAKEGAVLGKQVPVIVAYVSAFYIKRHHGGLCDCNVAQCGQINGKPNDLCHFGAQYIKQDLAAITNVYKSYAQGYAGCYGTTRPMIFEMEPDWYQYIINNQTTPLTKQEAASILDQYVSAIKQVLPNAYFSIDISPWVDDNGSDNGKDWYSHFDLSKYTFANTSGGSTDAASAKIRSSNDMTWAGVSQVIGKGVLADTGYGAGGMSAGHDANWDMVSNINARVADGVISISQYNPKSDWGSTIASIRSQLKTPHFCP